MVPRGSPLLGRECRKKSHRIEEVSFPPAFCVSGVTRVPPVLSHAGHTPLPPEEAVLANPLSGGYCGGVPPLPIPNREVKPASADGTAMQCGRVGRRPLFFKPLVRHWPRASYDARGLFSCLHHGIHGLYGLYSLYRFCSFYSVISFI